MIVNRFLDIPLTLRVKGAGSRSDETLGQYQQWLGPRTSDTGFNGRALHPVSFPNDDHFLSFQVHCD
jgi:hypothetical protein